MLLELRLSLDKLDGMKLHVSIIFIHSSVRSFTHIHSFIYSVNHSLTHPIIHSFIHSITHPFIHSFVCSSFVR